MENSPDAELDQFVYWIWAVCGSIVCAIGFVGNSMTVYVILFSWLYKRKEWLSFVPSRTSSTRKRTETLSESLESKFSATYEVEKHTIVSRRDLKLKKFGRSAAAVFLFGLAIFDNLVLVTFLRCFSLRHWFSNNSKCSAICENFESSEEVYKCFADCEDENLHRVYVVALVAHTGVVLTTVTFTVERYLAVKYPLQRFIGLIGNRERAIFIMGVVTLLSILYNIPRMMERIKWTENQDKHGMFASSEKYKFWYKKVIYTVFMFIIPCLILLILNIRLMLMVRKPRERKIRNDKHPNKIAIIRKSNRHSNHMTILVISVVSVFLISQSLILADEVLSLFSDPGEEDRVKPFSVIAQVMAPINSASNFFLYCCISRPFRQAFILSLSTFKIG
ncbi:hypothetical protein Ciccas_001423 [Cichlidogyrus casuarinus]|uniref:G-protein coupled receptors family 1 profile domain-containing protein n=1 Tax=Cichlidogyrus casuarinus TaxID=1844966 RepID=A0ABD2QK72_9PLAT